MRLKTDEKRNAILQVATDIFREVGYARASMTMISTRLGGSKGTLYGYFKSKDDLFAAAMMAVMDDQAQDAVALLDLSEPDIASALRRFGEAYLDLLTTNDALSIMRTAIAEGTNSNLGRSLYETGCERAWTDVENYLAQLHKMGLVRVADTRVAAAQLKGLLEVGVIEPLLYGAQPWFSKNEGVTNAIDGFLRIYRLP